MPGIQFFEMDMEQRDGAIGRSYVGRGDNGDIWLEAEYLNVSLADLTDLVKEEPKSVLLDGPTGKVFVNMRKFLAHCPYPDIQQDLTNAMDYYADLLHPTNVRR